ncbi:hypothetical protein Dsin_001989 [Dipteronia sinensis]|uniref:Ubiquitin-like protease family profile domain-containing protein n=1 Tax=Dipteronia sinensis TaxID=43782 RepID=A0AAE0EIU9_9ROSI|nr:hypothetical protein Dsin_001989 [Dipteronia sinensis]
MERVISLENLFGKRVATGYPRFSRWEFSAKTALFDWDVETFEKGTDYFKSLNLEYMCGLLIDKKREKLALPRSEEEEDLGSDHEGDDNQTGNDNDGIDCSVPSTIPELYDAMLESEQRIIAFCREEFSKIRNEMKNGAEQADDVVDDKGAGNNVTFVKDVEELNSVGEVGELGKDVQQDGDAVAEVGKGGEEDDAFGDVDAAFQGGKGEEKDDDIGDGNATFEGCKGDEQEDGVGENGKGSEQGVGNDGLVIGDIAFEGGKGDKQEDDVGEIGKGSKEGVGSDCVVVADAAFEGGKGDDQEDAAVGEIGTGCDQGVGSDGVVVGDATFEGDMVENNPNSVVALDGADPDVEYRDIDKQRGRKRSRWLESPWTDPTPKKKRKPQSNEEEINLVAFTSFLKNEDQLRLYVTYSLMYITTFTQHIHSYFDILWRRRSSSELNYSENIGLVNTSFFTNLNIKWAIEMDTLEAMRKIYKFEQAEKERRQQTETDYPEFVALNYQPSPDILRHVTGHDLLYPQPWWEMDSVLIPCHLPGHWVLCHVLFKERKVLLFDSLNERDETSHRLKDVCALLYLLPSLLKHTGYYEEMKMDPHASPFTVQSMGFELIPQQDDGYSCGVFLMKYAELILAGVKTPRKSVFGQKDIKDIRKAIAIDIYTNGHRCNSP